MNEVKTAIDGGNRGLKIAQFPHSAFEHILYLAKEKSCCITIVLTVKKRGWEVGFYYLKQ